MKERKKICWVRLLVIAGMTLGISLLAMRQIERMVLDNAEKVKENDNSNQYARRQEKLFFSLINAEDPELQRFALEYAERKYSYLPILIKAAKSGQQGVRVAAVNWLAEMTGEEDLFDRYQPKIFRSLASLLHDELPYIRMEAMRGIFHSKFPQKYEYLQDMIRDGNWIVRRRLASELGNYPDPEGGSRKIIKELLTDPDEDVRFVAVKAWLRIGNDPSITPLLPFLGSPDPFRRFQGIEALHLTKDPTIVKYWLNAILDIDPFIRFQAYENCFKGIDEFIEPKLLRLLQMIGLKTTGICYGLSGYSDWYSEFEHYEKESHLPLDKADRDALLLGLEDKDPQLRRYSALLLRDARLWTGQVAPALLRTIGDPEAPVRMNAAAALSDLASANAFIPLCRLLADPDNAVRENAITALGNFRNPKTVNLLLPFLQSGGRETIARALTALTKLNMPLPSRPLISLLTTSDPLIRAGAALALGHAKGRETLAALEKTLGDPVSYVRKNAADALAKLKWRPRNPQQQAEYWVASQEMKKCIALGKVALPALQLALNDPQDKIRLKAARAAYTIDPNINPTHYKKLLVGPDGRINNDALNMITDIKLTPAQYDLAALLEHDLISYERRNIGYALEQICDKKAIPALVKALKKSSNEAANSLDKLGWKPASDEENIYYYYGLNKWDELEGMMDSAFPILLDKLKVIDRCPAYLDWFNLASDELDEEFFKLMGRTKDKRVRSLLIRFYHKTKWSQFFPDWYAEVMGELGGAPAGAVLVEMLDHPDRDVRLQAAIALKKNPGYFGSLIPLIRATGDEEENVRIKAREALMQNILVEMLKILVLALLGYWLLRMFFSKLSCRLPGRK